MKSVDVAVIGGGILGLSLSLELARRGQRSAVFEREPQCGVHASGKNAGMIRHLYRHPQLTAWTARSIASWPDEAREKAFRRTGSWVLGRRIPAHHCELFAEGTHAVVDEGEVAPITGVYCADDGLLDSPTFIDLLQNRVVQTRAINLIHDTVRLVRRHQSGFVVATAKVEVHAAHVVNAAGAWAGRVLLSGGEPTTVPLQPFARHLFVVDGWDEDFMPAPDCGFFWDEAHGWYLRRWREPTSRLVSICDRVPADPEAFPPSDHARNEVAAMLAAQLPAIAPKLRFREQWMCFRTYAPDQLPVWGEDPNEPGFYWLAGFGGFGMSTGFAAAAELAGLVSGEPVSVPAELQPSRFSHVLAAPTKSALTVSHSNTSSSPAAEAPPPADPNHAEKPTRIAR